MRDVFLFSKRQPSGDELPCGTMPALLPLTLDGVSTDSVCGAPCGGVHPSRIVIHPSRTAGLADRVTDLFFWSTLATSLCARLYYPPPCAVLSHRQAHGSLSRSIEWSRYVTVSAEHNRSWSVFSPPAAAASERVRIGGRQSSGATAFFRDWAAALASRAQGRAFEWEHSTDWLSLVGDFAPHPNVTAILPSLVRCASPGDGSLQPRTFDFVGAGGLEDTGARAAMDGVATGGLVALEASPHVTAGELPACRPRPRREKSATRRPPSHAALLPPAPPRPRPAVSEPPPRPHASRRPALPTHRSGDCRPAGPLPPPRRVRDAARPSR